MHKIETLHDRNHRTMLSKQRRALVARVVRTDPYYVNFLRAVPRNPAHSDNKYTKSNGWCKALTNP